MREYRNLLIALGVMALLTPIGLYLPQILKAGAAWGEWGIHEVRKMVGYTPAGMEKTADTWKAPMPGYGPPGRGGRRAGGPRAPPPPPGARGGGAPPRRRAAVTGPMGESSREQRFLEMAESRGLRPAGRTYVEKTLRELSSFFTRSLFREETARRPGLLQRVDPRARLLAALFFLVS